DWLTRLCTYAYRRRPVGSATACHTALARKRASCGSQLMTTSVGEGPSSSYTPGRPSSVVLVWDAPDGGPGLRRILGHRARMSTFRPHHSPRPLGAASTRRPVEHAHRTYTGAHPMGEPGAQGPLAG